MRTSANFRRGLERMPYLEVRPTWPIPSLADDVRRGLLSTPRSLPPKHFYDAHGSYLFERICAAPEYYLTRTEASLLSARAEEIIAAAQPAHIIEFGSGNSSKTRHLFDACQRHRHLCTYWPFEVCEDTLVTSSLRLREDFGWLEVKALLGDYAAGLSYLPSASGTRMYVFLGSSLGNFDEAGTEVFFQQLRGCMRYGDWLLLGADRVKDPGVLHAAYNDAGGVTAKFNLNVLRVLNRELDADFDLSTYAHEAIYSEPEERMEMYLVALVRQRVRLAALDSEITLERGERILTEISRKYTYEGLEQILARYRLRVFKHYQPTDGAFSLILARSVATDN